MTLLVFLAVLGSALLHASWNALIKTGTQRLSVMLILTIVQGMMGLLITFTRPLPEGQVWLWLIASGLFHSAYKLFLTFAYNRGDLSRVYPIARGAAPFMVLCVTVLFLHDPLGGWEMAGVVILGLGILLMASGVFYAAEDRKLIPLALGSAVATAGYSLVDGMGARVAGDAVTYVAWLFVFDMVLFAPIVYARHGRGVFMASARSWTLGILGAVASYGAYAIVVWAMTVAPIALVAALRETSILAAMMIGVLVFGEKLGRTKFLAGVLIVLGAMITRL